MTNKNKEAYQRCAMAGCYIAWHDRNPQCIPIIRMPTAREIAEANRRIVAAGEARGRNHLYSLGLSSHVGFS